MPDKPNLTASRRTPTIPWGFTQSGDTMGAVGSEAGKLSGHDVRRVMLHVVQMAAGTGLTVLAENLGHLGLGPWQPVAAVAVTAAIDLLRRWVTSTAVVPVESAK